MNDQTMKIVLKLLKDHHEAFYIAKQYSDLIDQPTPEDSRASRGLENGQQICI